MNSPSADANRNGVFCQTGARRARRRCEHDVPHLVIDSSHPMFTAGNIEWTPGKHRSYLATKSEVLDHFEHCLRVIKQRGARR
jgi:hypothetical protein